MEIETCIIIVKTFGQTVTQFDLPNFTI